VYNATVTITNTDCDEASYDFAITAEVTCAPTTITACSGNITASTETTTCDKTVSYTITADGYPTPTVTYAFSGVTTGSGSGTGSGSTFAIGVTHVKVVTTNACGIDSCEFDVTVEDNTNPIATTQNLTVYLDANGAASITAAQINNGSSDACGVDTVYLNNYDFACSNVGANTVTLTVVDNNGNTDTETATVTVVDTVAPVALCQNVTVTLANGTASITTGDIDDSSNDACGILSLDVNTSSWDCNDIGNHTVTLTVTDNNDNVSTCDATVTVVGTIPSVTITDSELPEFCQGGTIVLTANATDGASFDYDWSTGETADEIQVSSADTFSVEVTNNYGCTASDAFYVDYDREDLVSAYTIISFNKEVKLDESNVSTGAVTALGNKGKVDIDKDSKVAGSSPFVKADEVKVKSGGVVDTKIEEEASLTLPSFQYSTHCNSKNDVTVGSNTSVTLTDSIYGKVKVGKNSKVTFTSSTLYMEDFSTSYDDTIKFTQSCVTMYVCKKVELKKNNIFNAEGKSVLIFVEEDFKIEKNSSAITSVYSEKHIHSEGDKNGDENELTGLFIAEKVHSKRTNWNWNTACGGCQSTQNKVTVEPVADLGGLLDATKLILNVYPNPNNGNFGVDIFSPEDGNYQVEVYDAFGRLVYTTGKQTLSGPTYVPIEMEATAGAQYFVRMSVNGEVHTKAILVRVD